MKSIKNSIYTPALAGLAGLTLAGLCGCGGSSASSSGTTTTTKAGLATGGATTVYVVEQSSTGTGTNSILQFPAGANGSSSPNLTLTAPTGFSAQAVALDSSGQLYVGGALSGQPEILIYASGASGTATPSRTILFGSANPYNPIESLAFDTAGSLYVVGFSGSVSVYSSTATGAATPTRTIAGALTGLSNAYVYGVAIDSSGNMYVSTGNSNLLGGAVLVFAAGATGNVAPTRTITSSTQVFFGIAVDSSGNVYAAEDNFAGTTAATIVQFSSTASGAATPTKTITLTGTTPSIFGGMRMDAVGNLYAVLQTEVGSGATATSSFSLVAVGPTATGSIAPVTQMTSSAWGFASSELAIK